MKAAALRKNEHFTETLTVVKTRFANASRLLLDGFATINAVADPSRTKVDLNALAETLRKEVLSVVPEDDTRPAPKLVAVTDAPTMR